MYNIYIYIYIFFCDTIGIQSGEAVIGVFLWHDFWVPFPVRAHSEEASSLCGGVYDFSLSVSNLCERMGCW